MGWKTAKTVGLTVALAVLQAGVLVDDARAQPPGQELRMRYAKRSLDIKARNADLKEILERLAAIADIAVEYPAALDKRITLNQRGLAIGDALDAMLIGINHVIFYAGPGPAKARVTKVKILGKATGGRPSRARGRQLAQRIVSYQRQIASLRQRLSTLDADSSRGRRYANRIRRLEQTVERLERQSY